MEPADIISSLRTGGRVGHICVEHLPLRCVCGVREEERRGPTTLYGHIAVGYDMGQCIGSDEISDAVDYSALASCAVAFAGKTRFYLLEKFADALCRHLLVHFPRALSIDLRLQKNPARWRGGGTSFLCSLSRRRSLAILGLGSNLGDRSRALAEAVERLVPYCRPLRSSSLHRTAPLLRTDQPEFLNRSLLIETLLSPMELLAATQSTERAMGRVRSERYGPRTIDIDLLLFEGFVSSLTALAVPHPGLRSRRFWIEELADLGLSIVPENETVWDQECEQVARGEEFHSEDGVSDFSTACSSR
ncbi:MAG: 2-amino-4-hydroxy-6-hydroxymethyldihydropteridine diphosphokinase [Puniceicoccales bacterium]|jgi:2-amino-4-hydroxy-6-hydroxymethyldihydropteridine diphosphokinase/dihydroneopterin aldolase|nr:2-amino-4-hydroxy-6-hydroxymethyldihydropteridine diphosphokinase [Puniceicoccales bacterium]